MLEGIVRFVHPKNLYAFVSCDDAGPDCYIHGRALERAGITNLSRGERLEFERVPSRKFENKFEARDVRRVDSTEPSATTANGISCPECDRVNAHRYDCAIARAAA